MWHKPQLDFTMYLVSFIAFLQQNHPSKKLSTIVSLTTEAFLFLNPFSSKIFQPKNIVLLICVQSTIVIYQVVEEVNLWTCDLDQSLQVYSPKLRFKVVKYFGVSGSTLCKYFLLCMRLWVKKPLWQNLVAGMGELFFMIITH